MPHLHAHGRHGHTYVIVHVGFALTVADEAEPRARSTYTGHANRMTGMIGEPLSVRTDAR
ncbi:hypothetical protein [Streptomyces sp. NBC_01451]|uniref:hypothetical protein n=1 Tax=Streptomyces sp. NBC_01451 TaxID=2903872 RepID=UPI002E35E8A6|nr:hypothetical protein [Streptomyces sp. NBC_01451]